ncbi:MAG: hypothetical protein WEE50_11720 [Chloroflexota bacterium]
MADTRKCIGSTRFGIEAHEAPIEDFPAQPSQKDGLGRMCKVHWNQYTAGLARDAKARKTADGTTEPAETTPEPVQTKSRRAKGNVPEPGGATTETSIA